MPLSLTRPAEAAGMAVKPSLVLPAQPGRRSPSLVARRSLPTDSQPTAKGQMKEKRKRKKIKVFANVFLRWLKFQN